MSDKAVAQQSRKQTGANVGPGDQTVAEILSPGLAFLDYYAQRGPTTFNVVFLATGNANATIQIDFGPQQPLPQGWKQFTFNQTLQLAINNISGQCKYGWVALT